MGAVRAFSAGNYTRQPVSASLFVNSVDLFVLMDADSEVNKDISSKKMLGSIATLEVQIKYTFFDFIPYIYLLVGKQGYKDIHTYIYIYICMYVHIYYIVYTPKKFVAFNLRN